MGFLFVATLIIISYFQFDMINVELQRNKKSFEEGSALLGIYTDVSWVANEI